MAAFSRGIRPLLRPPGYFYVCSQCRRALATSPSLRAGHNRWSKIRHQKGAADAKKTAVISQFTKSLTLYSKLYGPDPSLNKSLAATIHAAKKAGLQKSTIEAAISRGQGRALDGASLEVVTFEAVMSPSVALIIDVETDNKLRAMQDVNDVLKRHKARVGSSTKFFFSRLGRVIFEKGDASMGVDEIFDCAVEAGAEDLDTDEDGNIVVWTAPTSTSKVCQAVESAFGLKILSSDIVWSPNEETKVKIDSSEDLQLVVDLVLALREFPDIQAISCNASRGAVSEEKWAQLEDNLDL